MRVCQACVFRLRGANVTYWVTQKVRSAAFDDKLNVDHVTIDFSRRTVPYLGTRAALFEEQESYKKGVCLEFSFISCGSQARFTTGANSAGHAKRCKSRRD